MPRELSDPPKKPSIWEAFRRFVGSKPEFDESGKQVDTNPDWLKGLTNPSPGQHLAQDLGMMLIPGLASIKRVRTKVEPKIAPGKDPQIQDFLDDLFKISSEEAYAGGEFNQKYEPPPYLERARAMGNAPQAMNDLYKAQGKPLPAKLARDRFRAYDPDLDRVIPHADVGPEDAMHRRVVQQLPTKDWSNALTGTKELKQIFTDIFFNNRFRGN